MKSNSPPSRVLYADHDSTTHKGKNSATSILLPFILESLSHPASLSASAVFLYFEHGLEFENYSFVLQMARLVQTVTRAIADLFLLSAPVYHSEADDDRLFWLERAVNTTCVDA
jgi:hypothetical protein